jgi:hypothetical protein
MEEILEIQKLANSKNYKDRIKAAQHPALLHLAQYTALKLTNDTHELVRKAIAERDNLFIRGIKLIEYLTVDKSSKVKKALAKHKDLFLDDTQYPFLIEKLATDKDVKVRQELANNKNLLIYGKYTAYLLAHDKSAKVREILAKNIGLSITYHHNLTQKIIEKLSQDKNKKVRKIINELIKIKGGKIT